MACPTPIAGRNSGNSDEGRVFGTGANVPPAQAFNPVRSAGCYPAAETLALRHKLFPYYKTYSPRSSFATVRHPGFARQSRDQEIRRRCAAAAADPGGPDARPRDHVAGLFPGDAGTPHRPHGCRRRRICAASSSTSAWRRWAIRRQNFRPPSGPNWCCGQSRSGRRGFGQRVRVPVLLPGASIR